MHSKYKEDIYNSILTNKFNLFYLTFIIFFLLESCQLKNDYTKTNKIIHSLKQIEVESINTIHGTELYHALISILKPSDEIKYKLVISISTDSSFDIIQKNSNIFRKKNMATISYKLVNIENNQILTSDTINNFSVNNNLSSPFENLEEQEKNFVFLIQESAELIRNKLFFYFLSKKEKNENLSKSN